MNSLELLRYELQMFAWSLSVTSVAATTTGNWSFSRMATLPGIVELRVLHARNLAEFLLSEPKRSDDLVAADYLESFQAVERASLLALLGRVGKHLAHITTERVRDEEHALGKDKNWGPQQFGPVLSELVRFLEGLAGSRWWASVPVRERKALGDARSALEAMSDAYTHRSP